MRELGYLEGRDYGVEDRYADGDVSRLPVLAEELVRLKPDVIVAATTSGVLAVKQATANVPIVGVNLTDLVSSSPASLVGCSGAWCTSIS
jgi:putative ABC transport system substrate-binding protein